MSITSSLNSALSGLVASSRSAELVSNNIANALTEGYGRREIELSARDLGGVRVDAISRRVDETIIADRRLADASLGQERSAKDFYEQLERILGAIDDPSSIQGRVTTFNAALIEAAARPDSEVRLQGLFDAATAVTEGLNQTSDDIQALREQADIDIANEVDRLNEGLASVADYNADILRARAAGRDASSLIDQRQQAIDAIAEIVPIREIPRDNGTVALVTPTGALLVDTSASVVGFTARPVITPDMTIGSGALSGLTLNGAEIRTSGTAAPLGGGTLAANFAIRDELAVGAQAQVDALARDLVERFQDPALDTTLTAGDPGIFTDAGTAFAPADELGLAARISVNGLLDSSAGGAVWRFRDGLGATAQGPVGENALLTRLGEALNEQRTTASGEITGAARSAGALAGDLLSLVSVDRVAADAALGFAAARQENLKDIELAGGVDTDQELQKLLLIEQAYTANARVITTASEMIDTLLRI
ncbi:MAG: flagellar hook-associated protein FlgK [Pseudomonadota bacterium]